MTAETVQAVTSLDIQSKKPLTRTVSTGSVSTAKASTPKKRKSVSLPPETVEYLKNWIMSPEHIAHPYPTEHEKAQIMEDTGIELKQLTNWFVNNRKRYWKPRVEARLREQSARVSPSRLAKADSSSSSGTGQLNTFIPGDLVTTISEESLLEHGRSNPTTQSTPRVPAVVSPGRFVSAPSSIASDTSSVTSNEGYEDPLSAGQTTEEFTLKTEIIQVHVLRPVSGGAAPSIEDVTVLHNIPQERTLRTYNDCLLTYRCAAADTQDSKKIQRRRDAEIVRLKKQYLKLFLSEMESIAAAEAGAKRKHVIVEEHDETYYSPRPKFRRVSVELWKEACQTAGSVYDQELPSLEEAKTLFGFDDEIVTYSV